MYNLIFALLLMHGIDIDFAVGDTQLVKSSVKTTNFSLFR